MGKNLVVNIISDERDFGFDASLVIVNTSATGFGLVPTLEVDSNFYRLITVKFVVIGVLDIHDVRHLFCEVENSE
jgi:hypothetical protein